MATTSSGQVVVIDAGGQLVLLTKRGELVGTVSSGVRAVAAGGGKIFAVNDRLEFVTLDDLSGKVLGRARLGLGVSPTGLSYDAARNIVWMVFASGMVQARRTDGTVVAHFGSSATGPLFGLTDVAADAASGVVWVAQDHESPSGMIFGLDPASGARVKVIGAGGNGPAKITGAILVGEGGRIHVSDLNANRIEVVSADGAHLQTIGVSATGEGLLSQPAGLAFLENGDLLVSSLFASRIDRFGSGAPLPVCEGDADCDRMNDAWETANGLNPFSAEDALADLDADGLPNAQEYALGTDPGKADTDGDGDSDAVELANGTDPLTPPNRKPVVFASGATEFVPGIVRLSAIVTEIADPSKCTAVWTRIGEGTPVTLASAKGFAPTFVARKAETYRFTVVATCAGVSSDAVEVAASVVNVAPLAHAHRFEVVDVGGSQTLDAGRSGDANADALTFVWDQVSGPVVTGGSATPVLTARFESPGTHRFRATVSDPESATGEAETSVVVVGKQRVPVAVAASPVVGEVGKRIALDARASIVSGEASYAWRQVEGPAAQVAGDGLPQAAFVAPEAGRYAFEVTVTKAGITSPPALVEALVSGVGQSLPVAVGSAPAVAAVGTEVKLDGVASVSGSGGTLQYAWRQTAGPATGVASADRALASAYLFEPGSYEFELTVKDGAAVSRAARVRVEARRDGKPIPVARVTAPGAALVGDRITLDGRASVGAVGFHWTQVGGPWVLREGGSVAVIKPKAAGTYVFELEVDDGKVLSAPARVSVVVTGDETEN
ncbi:MAG: hypothetical protein WCC48_18240 [Anaeromyxobacteraceae bacterium]